MKVKWIKIKLNKRLLCIFKQWKPIIWIVLTNKSMKLKI